MVKYNSPKGGVAMSSIKGVTIATDWLVGRVKEYTLKNNHNELGQIAIFQENLEKTLTAEVEKYGVSFMISDVYVSDNLLEVFRQSNISLINAPKPFRVIVTKDNVDLSVGVGSYQTVLVKTI